MSTREQVLRMLQETDGFLSGVQMSQTLGVSRMAVCKAIASLQQDGFLITALPRRGYRLQASCAKLSAPGILATLGEHPWRERLVVLDEVDSTNTYAKRLAAQGAPEGTVVVSNAQTGGRGRLGRSFSSPMDCGVYLTVLLRPRVAPTELLHLTALTAEATVQAIEDTAGLRPGIKWTNDLVCGKRKLCGILTELSVEAESGLVDSVVAGIGVNCGQTPEDFPPEVRAMATSLLMELGHPVDRNALAAAMIRRLSCMAEEYLTEKASWLANYARDCVTIGQDVKVVRGDTERCAHADGIDENAALLVTYPDGQHDTVLSGEVSIRGMYGYL